MTEPNSHFKNFHWSSASSLWSEPQWMELRAQIATQSIIDRKVASNLLDDFLYYHVTSGFEILDSLSTVPHSQRKSIVDAHNELKNFIKSMIMTLQSITGRVNWGEDEINSQRLLVKSLRRWEKLGSEQVSEEESQPLKTIVAEIRQWISREIDSIGLTKAAPKAGQWFGPHCELLYSNQSFWDSHDRFKAMIPQWEDKRYEEDQSLKFRKVAQEALRSLNFTEGQGSSYNEEQILPRQLDVRPSCLEYDGGNFEARWSDKLGYNRLKEALKGGLTPEDLEKDAKFFNLRQDEVFRRHRLLGGSSPANSSNDNNNEDDISSHEETTPQDNEETESEDPEESDEFTDARKWFKEYEALLNYIMQGSAEDSKWNLRQSTTEIEKNAMISRFRDAMNSQKMPLMFFGPEPHKHSALRNNLTTSIKADKDEYYKKLEAYMEASSEDDTPWTTEIIQKEVESLNSYIAKWLSDSQGFLGELLNPDGEGNLKFKIKPANSRALDGMKKTDAKNGFKDLIKDGWHTLMTYGVGRLSLQNRLFKRGVTSRTDRLDADIGFLEILNGHEQLWNEYDEFHYFYDRIQNPLSKTIHDIRRERRQDLIRKCSDSIESKRQQVAEQTSIDSRCRKRPRVSESSPSADNDGSRQRPTKRPRQESQSESPSRQYSEGDDDDDDDDDSRQPPAQRGTWRIFKKAPTREAMTQTEPGDTEDDPCDRKFRQFLDAWIRSIEDELRELVALNDMPRPRSSEPRSELSQQNIDARIRAARVIHWTLTNARQRPPFEAPPRVPEAINNIIHHGTSRPANVPGLSHPETGRSHQMFGLYVNPQEHALLRPEQVYRPPPPRQSTAPLTDPPSPDRTVSEKSTNSQDGHEGEETGAEEDTQSSDRTTSERSSSQDEEEREDEKSPDREPEGPSSDGNGSEESGGSRESQGSGETNAPAGEDTQSSDRNVSGNTASLHRADDSQSRESTSASGNTGGSGSNNDTPEDLSVCPTAYPCHAEERSTRNYWYKVFTPATGLYCGLEALRISIENQMKEYKTPTVDELREIIYSLRASWEESMAVLGEDNGGEMNENNFTIDQIAAALYHWGRNCDENVGLQLVLVRDNHNDLEMPVEVGLPGPAIRRLYIHNDNAQDPSLRIIGHYSGLAPMELPYIAKTQTEIKPEDEARWAKSQAQQDETAGGSSQAQQSETTSQPSQSHPVSPADSLFGDERFSESGGDDVAMTDTPDAEGSVGNAAATSQLQQQQQEEMRPPPAPTPRHRQLTSLDPSPLRQIDFPPSSSSREEEGEEQEHDQGAMTTGDNNLLSVPDQPARTLGENEVAAMSYDERVEWALYNDAKLNLTREAAERQKQERQRAADAKAKADQEAAEKLEQDLLKATEEEEEARRLARITPYLPRARSYLEDHDMFQERKDRAGTTKAAREASTRKWEAEVERLVEETAEQMAGDDEEGKEGEETLVYPEQEEEIVDFEPEPESAELSVIHEEDEDEDEEEEEGERPREPSSALSSLSKSPSPPLPLPPSSSDDNNDDKPPPPPSTGNHSLPPHPAPRSPSYREKIYGKFLYQFVADVPGSSGSSDASSAEQESSDSDSDSAADKKRNRSETQKEQDEPALPCDAWPPLRDMLEQALRTQYEAQFLPGLVAPPPPPPPPPEDHWSGEDEEEEEEERQQRKSGRGSKRRKLGREGRYEEGGGGREGEEEGQGDDGRKEFMEL